MVKVEATESPFKRKRDEQNDSKSLEVRAVLDHVKTGNEIYFKCKTSDGKIVSLTEEMIAQINNNLVEDYKLRNGLK